MENVYPKIKEYCRERHGLEFQVSITLHVPLPLRQNIRARHSVQLHVHKHIFLKFEYFGEGG